MTFGESLRAIRKKRGLTQKGLADVLGVKSDTSVTWYENGSANVTIPTAVKIADALGADLYFDNKTKQLVLKEKGDESKHVILRKRLSGTGGRNAQDRIKGEKGR